MDSSGAHGITIISPNLGEAQATETSRWGHPGEGSSWRRGAGAAPMLSLCLCEGFSSALGPAGAAPGCGGKLRDGSHHPKRSPSRRHQQEGAGGREDPGKRSFAASFNIPSWGHGKNRHLGCIIVAGVLLNAVYCFQMQ